MRPSASRRGMLGSRSCGSRPARRRAVRRLFGGPAHAEPWIWKLEDRPRASSVGLGRTASRGAARASDWQQGQLVVLARWCKLHLDPASSTMALDAGEIGTHSPRENDHGRRASRCEGHASTRGRARCLLRGTLSRCSGGLGSGAIPRRAEHLRRLAELPGLPARSPASAQQRGPRRMQSGLQRCGLARVVREGEKREQLEQHELVKLQTQGPSLSSEKRWSRAASASSGPRGAESEVRACTLLQDDAYVETQLSRRLARARSEKQHSRCARRPPGRPAQSGCRRGRVRSLRPLLIEETYEDVQPESPFLGVGSATGLESSPLVVGAEQPARRGGAERCALRSSGRKPFLRHRAHGMHCTACRSSVDVARSHSECVEQGEASRVGRRERGGERGDHTLAGGQREPAWTQRASSSTSQGGTRNRMVA